MTHLHWTFVAVAYGFTVACIVGELVALRLRRRRALERVAREHDVDETDA